VNKIPEEMWRAKLIAHIPIELLMKVRAKVHEEDGPYESLVEALTGTSTLTFSAAAEDLCTGER